ncbi:hypothetical protein [Tengunoibacter tsumagoiensis]|uniref:General stress protein 17M-like domain-containing protein n=1 Tax=Tengunoibacter tsumagoiensis TaxID=2014871 RepID=A0A401ZWH2_9CHLR|nr:hypothetical protein [Tengunoibacter tsumagoiensis]GCE11084.1 hypothetical protein KTT_09430 [Tengunoibacter tsumagoiensis]
MTTYQIPLVVGVFPDTQTAKNAVDALRSAGFKYDQVGVAMRTENQELHNLQQDLVNLGVAEDRADHFDEEYKAGHVVVSVRPDGREREAREILDSQGAAELEGSNIQSQPSMPAAMQTQQQDSAADMQAQQQDPAALSQQES